jgi:hypothetical protein
VDADTEGAYVVHKFAAGQQKQRLRRGTMRPIAPFCAFYSEDALRKELAKGSQLLQLRSQDAG